MASDMDDTITTILDRVTTGAAGEADLVALRSALLVTGEQNIVQVGKYNVQIGHGQEIQIGDRVYEGPDAAAIQEALRQVLLPLQAQQERIAEGLKAVRAEMAATGRARASTGRTRVAGQRPQEVSEYFKDRITEMNKVWGLLTNPTTRMVSIIGQGGMGKTALACKVLNDFERHRWPELTDGRPVDGIVYLSTRTAGVSLERVFLGCSKLLDADEEKRLVAVWTNPQLSTKDKVTQLLEALVGGTYIVLLDNLEDLLDGDGRLLDHELQVFLEQNVESGAAARLLVTSRQALALEFRVLRFDQQVKLVDGLPVQEGVAMLRDLDPNGEYGLRDAADDSLAAAVKRVHGVPRAIEVLAGILANDPLATLDEVLAGFYEYEDVVQGLITENCRRLSQEARQVMAALAVLRRPVPVVAVDYLLAPFAVGLNVPAVVRQLARTGIVSVDRAAKTIALHPIDQDYAYSQLPDEANGATGYTCQALERRAAAYYTELRTPEETWKTIDDLAPQLAEFEHLVRAEDYIRAFQVLDAIDSEYLNKWGYHARTVVLHDMLTGHLMDPDAEASNANGLADHYRSLGQIERAKELYHQAIDLARQTANRNAEVVYLGNAGSAYRDSGEFEKAIWLYEEAVTLARRLGSRQVEALNLGRLGFAYRLSGDVERSINLQREAVEIAADIGDRRREGAFYNGLGQSYYYGGQMEKAEQCYRSALDLARLVGSRWSTIIALGGLGGVQRALGHYDEAIKLHREALDIAREIGEKREESNELGSLGSAYLALGRSEDAIGFYGEAVSIDRLLRNDWRRSAHLTGLGRAHLALGALDEAQRFCLEALRLEIEEFAHGAALTLAIALLQAKAPEACNAFSDAFLRSQKALARADQSFRARYSAATSMVGQTVCKPEWFDKAAQAKLLAPALTLYRRALETCSAPGIVGNSFRDLELIQVTGVKGLESVFGLLEGYVLQDVDSGTVGDATMDDDNQTS